LKIGDSNRVKKLESGRLKELGYRDMEALRKNNIDDNNRYAMISLI
jgi:hypothetical protein